MSNTDILDLTDSDVLKIERVYNDLMERFRRRSVLLNDFQKEAEDKFAQIGFKVRVDMYETNYPGVYMPEITIQDRYEGEFDPDQMVYEVTKDILDLGTEGVIDSKPMLNPDGTKKLILPKK